MVVEGQGESRSISDVTKPLRQPQAGMARLKEVPWFAPQCPTQLGEGSQSDVLAGALQPIERRTADPQRPGHLSLREPCLSPEAAERLCQ